MAFLQVLLIRVEKLCNQLKRPIETFKVKAEEKEKEKKQQQQSSQK